MDVASQLLAAVDLVALQSISVFFEPIKEISSIEVQNSPVYVCRPAGGLARAPGNHKTSGFGSGNISTDAFFSFEDRSSPRSAHFSEAGSDIFLPAQRARSRVR